jgi:hypothetical protein
LNDTTQPSKYTAESKRINATEVKPVAETMEMERMKMLKPYRPINYDKEAKKLAMKYGLTSDDNKLAASLLSSKITSDLLYRKHYNSEIRGTTANNPEIAYEMSTQMAKVFLFRELCIGQACR